MTPEEKANELIEKFIPEINELIPMAKSGLSGAKACAIICVDEIIKSYEGQTLYKERQQVINFWQQVKSFIQKQ